MYHVKCLREEVDSILYNLGTGENSCDVAKEYWEDSLGKCYEALDELKRLSIKKEYNE